VGLETGTVVGISDRTTEELGISEGIDCGTLDDFKTLRSALELGIDDGRLDVSELGMPEGIDDGTPDGSELGILEGIELG